MLNLGEKKVYSFGDATDGCLGLESDDNRKNVFVPTPVKTLGNFNISYLTAGLRHAACISDTGELYCWGFNYYDQLGVGETKKNYNM